MNNQVRGGLFSPEEYPSRSRIPTFSFQFLLDFYTTRWAPFWHRKWHRKSFKIITIWLWQNMLFSTFFFMLFSMKSRVLFRMIFVGISSCNLSGYQYAPLQNMLQIAMKTHVFQLANKNEIQVFSCGSGTSFWWFYMLEFFEKNVGKCWRKSIKIVQKISYEPHLQKVLPKLPKMRSKSSSKNVILRV